jgi:hypothetical protein
MLQFKGATMSPGRWMLAACGLALSGLAALSPLAAQGLPSPLAPSNSVPIVYCPPERLSAGAPAPQHVLNVFLPLGAPPASGWPVVVATGYGGGAAVPPAGALSARGASAPLWDLVAAGIAVVHFGTPGLGGGRGLWYPPGHPSGRYESFRPADDNPEKSAEWALQWVKVQARYPFDLARIALRGSSGGAVLAIRTAMGPERARSSGSAHVRASTRVAAILAIQPPTSAWALEQGPELTIPFPRHLEQAAFPGVPATQLSQVLPELQKDYSLMRVAFESVEARAHNAQQPLCLVYGDPVLRLNGAVAPFDLDGTGFPIVHDAIRQPLQHDSWFGYMFWKRLIGLSSQSAAFHAANSVFAMRDAYALAPPLAYHTRTYSGGVMGVRARRIGHDWLVARLTGLLPGMLAAPSGPPPGSRSGAALVVLPDPGCAGGPGDGLVLLGAEEGSRPRVVLGLRDAPGDWAWLVLGRVPLGAERAALAERCGWGAPLGPPTAVRLELGSDGLTRIRVELPVLSPSEALRVQVWLHSPRAAPRVRPGGALLLLGR